MAAGVYPSNPAERTEWIVSRRPNWERPQVGSEPTFLMEQEPVRSGGIATVATIFLLNRECPWRCVMCDLWRNTVESATTPGSIVSQVEAALQQLPPAQVIKLYNSGSFFDLGAVPIADRMRIAGMLSGFEKVIVECHPRLMQNAAIDFAVRIEGTLEIAFGLETAHPEALEKLNKRINRENYLEAVRRCKSSGIEVRTFLLVNPPFVSAAQQREWLEKSVQFAFDAGSDVVSLIPTRGGNGALEELQAYGEFSEPGLADVENGLQFALALNRGIAFADTWDLKRFSGCEFCFLPRAERIQRMNLSQQVEPEPICGQCGAGS